MRARRPYHGRPSQGAPACQGRGSQVDVTPPAPGLCLDAARVLTQAGPIRQPLDPGRCAVGGSGAGAELRLQACVRLKMRIAEDPCLHEVWLRDVAGLWGCGRKLACDARGLRRARNRCELKALEGRTHLTWERHRPL